VSSRRFKLLLQTFRLHQIQNRSSFFRQKNFTANQKNNSSFTRPKKPTLKAARIGNDLQFPPKTTTYSNAAKGRNFKEKI
jgi:hypothetical protein